MTVQYAPEEIGKDVTRQLKAVAFELKTRDQLHLPDFLEVDPCASYEEWARKLSERRKKIKNAPEGTADAQEKLCQSLAKEFNLQADGKIRKEDQKGWHRLLNRLGRMEIESSIGSLARRKPGAEMLRNVFDTHVHTLKFVVGAPDAREIVEELSKEKALDIPKEPKPVAKPQAETVPPQLELIPAQPETSEVQ